MRNIALNPQERQQESFLLHQAKIKKSIFGRISCEVQSGDWLGHFTNIRFILEPVESGDREATHRDLNRSLADLGTNPFVKIKAENSYSKSVARDREVIKWHHSERIISIDYKEISWVGRYEIETLPIIRISGGEIVDIYWSVRPFREWNLRDEEITLGSMYEELRDGLRWNRPKYANRADSANSMARMFLRAAFRFGGVKTIYSHDLTL